MSPGASIAPVLILLIQAHFALPRKGPSLFLQPNRSTCSLHVDSGNTHFWQLLRAGRKRWRIGRADDWSRFFVSHERWSAAFFRDARCNGMFGEEAAAAAGCDGESRADDAAFGPISAFDDAALASVGGELDLWQAIAGPGDLIFVPAEAPHQVTTELAPEGGAAAGDSGMAIAVSMNFVSGSNLDAAQRAVREVCRARRGWPRGPSLCIVAQVAPLSQAPDYHEKYRARLRKGGQPVKASSARWFERVRMALEPPAAEQLRLYVATNPGGGLAADIGSDAQTSCSSAEASCATDSDSGGDGVGGYAIPWREFEREAHGAISLNYR